MNVAIKTVSTADKMNEGYKVAVVLTLGIIILTL
jgi:hypothetical protein